MPINSEHKVLWIGSYNNLVSQCGFCFAEIDYNRSDCIGFSEQPPTRAGYVDKIYAVIYECPKCFERQWHHAVQGGYNIFLRYRSKQNA